VHAVGAKKSHNRPNKYRTNDDYKQTTNNNKWRSVTTEMSNVIRRKECVMRNTNSHEPAEILESLENDIISNTRELTRNSAALRQADNGNGELSAPDLGTLLRRVAEASTREVEALIDELGGLRKKLMSDGDRIQGDIERYAELSQGVMQLAAIISDSVKKIPGAPTLSQ
jgi:hypothetical protein